MRYVFITKIYRIVLIPNYLPLVDVGDISKDLVVFPDVYYMDAMREGGRGNEIDSKLFPTKELLQEGEVILGAVGAD